MAQFVTVNFTAYMARVPQGIHSILTTKLPTLPAGTAGPLIGNTMLRSVAAHLPGAAPILLAFAPAFEVLNNDIIANPLDWNRSLPTEHTQGKLRMLPPFKKVTAFAAGMCYRVHNRDATIMNAKSVAAIVSENDQVFKLGYKIACALAAKDRRN